MWTGGGGGDGAVDKNKFRSHNDCSMLNIYFKMITAEIRQKSISDEFV